MEKYLNTSLYADCPSHVYDCGRRPPWASMPPILRAWLLTSLSVLWWLQTPGTRLRGVAPLTDGAAGGTWKGETDASGLLGGDLAVVLARMLLPGVPLCGPDTTGGRVPLFEARPWKVKGLNLVVNRSKVRRDSHVYDCGRRPPWASMPPILRAWLLTSLSVLWWLQTPGTRLRGVAPLTDGAAGGTWKGETDASGLLGGDLAVVLARMLLPGVPLCGPDTTGGRVPLFEARPWKVKGLNLVVNRSKVRRDGARGGSNAAGASHRPLIHVGWRDPLVKARASKVKELDPVVKRCRVWQDGGHGGVAMPPEHRTGPSYMPYGVVACPKRRHACPGCGPPHGRR